MSIEHPDQDTAPIVDVDDAVTFKVGKEDTAIALGSGDVPVLATPRLLAWMESATVHAAAAFLEPDQTSVGTSVRLTHSRPTAIGLSVSIFVTSAVLSDPRRLSFSVRAVDSNGELVGQGEVYRAVVDRQRFLAAAHGAAD